jgi:hypothetical protein
MQLDKRIIAKASFMETGFPYVRQSLKLTLAFCLFRARRLWPMNALPKRQRVLGYRSRVIQFTA